MQWKKLLLIHLILALACFSGCVGQGRGLADEDGNLWQLSPGELDPGIYIKNGEYYNPLLEYGLTFTGAEDEHVEDRIVWIYDYRHLIPLLSDETILIEYSPDKYPTEPVIFEHFVSKGYSFGALFERDGQDLRFPSSSSRICPGSSISQSINAHIDSAQNTRITEFNEFGASFPKNNIHGSGYMMGLEKDGLYRIGYYEGTLFNHFLAYADTEIYMQDAAYAVTEREPTKEGYFIIRPPEDMPKGLYCVNGKMLVFYASGKLDAVQTPEPTPSPTPKPTPSPVVGTIETTQMPSPMPTPTAQTITMTEIIVQ